MTQVITENENNASKWKTLRNHKGELVLHEHTSQNQTIEHFSPTHQQNFSEFDDFYFLIETLLVTKQIDEALSVALKSKARILELSESFE